MIYWEISKDAKMLAEVWIAGFYQADSKISNELRLKAQGAETHLILRKGSGMDDDLYRPVARD
jgi:hypothetical protein